MAMRQDSCPSVLHGTHLLLHPAAVQGHGPCCPCLPATCCARLVFWHPPPPHTFPLPRVLTPQVPKSQRFLTVMTCIALLGYTVAELLI